MRISYTVIALALFILGCLCGDTYKDWQIQREISENPVVEFKDPSQIKELYAFGPCKVGELVWHKVYPLKDR